MKKILLGIALLTMLCIPMFIITQEAQADVTLNLKATWNPNPESDMYGYYFYWTYLNGGLGTDRIWTGTDFTITESLGLLLPLAPQQLLFPITIPSTPDTGTLKFSMKAVDMNLNRSALCGEAPYVYNIDTTPPGLVTGLAVVKQ
jgi:hypothetical protein